MSRAARVCEVAGLDGLEGLGGAQHYVTVGQECRLVVGQLAVAEWLGCQSAVRTYHSKQQTQIVARFASLE